MATTPDKRKRDELTTQILERLAAAGVDTQKPTLSRARLEKNDSTLAKILNEYVMSKSWRTDPKSTAKQVAESLVARDQTTRLASLLSKLEKELKGSPPPAAPKKRAAKKSAPGSATAKKAASKTKSSTGRATKTTPAKKSRS